MIYLITRHKRSIWRRVLTTCRVRTVARWGLRLVVSFDERQPRHRFLAGPGTAERYSRAATRSADAAAERQRCNGITEMSTNSPNTVMAHSPAAERRRSEMLSRLTNQFAAMSAAITEPASQTPARHTRTISTTTSGSSRTRLTKNTCTGAGANPYAWRPPRARLRCLLLSGLRIL